MQCFFSPEAGGSASTEQHRAKSPRVVTCAVITISDTRTEADDLSGKTMIEKLEAEGHSVAFYRVVKDEEAAIRGAIEAAMATEGVRAVLTNGGTGIAGRDVTYPTISGLLEKRLDGFGEIFRMLSFQEIGPAAMLSRAVAGVYRRTAIFSTPGSVHAVKLAMDRLIAPEIGHVVHELDK